jgi:hypothetical protein
MPTPLTYQKVQRASGPLSIPIYNIGDFPNPPLRVMTSKGLGCYDLVAPIPSLPLRIMTAAGIKAINTVVDTGPPPLVDATVLVVQDNFTRANSTTTLGSTTTGQAWQKYGSGVYGIQSNQAYPVTLAWDYPVYVETGISDNFDYVIKIATVGTGNQIMWRIIDSNFNFFVISGSNVRRVVNNTWTTIGTIPTLVNGDVVKIQVRGNVHTIKVNGVQRAQVTDSAHLTGTKVGFSTNSTTSRFDDITVHKL